MSDVLFQCCDETVWHNVVDSNKLKKCQKSKKFAAKFSKTTGFLGCTKLLVKCFTPSSKSPAHFTPTFHYINGS